MAISDQLDCLVVTSSNSGGGRSRGRVVPLKSAAVALVDTVTYAHVSNTLKYSIRSW